MSPQDGVPPKQAAQIKQLLANRQVGPALDLAKRVHKRYANAASETLLVDAHLAWIHAQLAKNLSADAKVAIDFVRENHPAFTERLEEVSTLLAAQQGDLDALLHPLNLPTLAPEKHDFIAQCVRRYVVDLAALSQCGLLPLEHPWRLAAAALARMFEAVTSGPVEDQALALPEISRGNPLSPWKMLLRAVASFYRHEDELCEKYLAAIEPEAAAARLVPALQALMGKSATLTSATRALATQTGGSLGLLRSKLRDLDQALAKPRINQARIAAGIKDAVTACEESCPEAL